MSAGRLWLVLACALTACVQTPQQAALEATRDAEKAAVEAQKAASIVAANDPATSQSNARALPTSPEQPISMRTVEATSQPSLVDLKFSQRFKNEFFVSCLKDMSSGEDSLPPELSGQVCACAAGSLVASFNAEQLQQVAIDVAANFSVLAPHMKTCVESELPKYIQTHPDFIGEYASENPEILP